MDGQMTFSNSSRKSPRRLFNDKRVIKIQVGIDFGSKFTKIAYRIMGGRETSQIMPLDMKLSNVDCGCIIPSSVGILERSENGRKIWYPERIGGDGRDLKTSLLRIAGVIDVGRAEDDREAKAEQTVFFFWWLFKKILERLRDDPQVGKYCGENLRDYIIFNVCIPIAKVKEHDGKLNGLYEKILRCALKYSKIDQKFFDVDALRREGGVFAEVDEKPADQILITPEPIAQVLPYMKYAQGRQGGKHIIIDIGGETIDFSIFDVGADFQKLEIYNTYVHISGMGKIEHELMRSRDIGLNSIYELLYTYRGKSGVPARLRENERSHIQTYFKDVHTKAKGRECFGSAYAKHPITSAWANLHVLLVGGGAYSKSVFYKDLCKIFKKPLWSSSDKPGEYKEYHVNEYTLRLPSFAMDRCRNMERNLHRMLVAYGLCIEKKEYPKSLKPYMIKSKEIKESSHIMDDPNRTPYHLSE